MWALRAVVAVAVAVATVVVVVIVVGRGYEMRESGAVLVMRGR